MVFYSPAKVIHYKLKVPSNDDSLSTLERMQHLDAAYSERLEHDAFMQYVISKYVILRQSPTPKDLAVSPAIKDALELAGLMAKQRATLCILQEQRMRRNFDWIDERERERVAREVKSESCSILNELEDYEIACRDESFAHIAEELEQYTMNPMHPSTRHVIKDE